MDLTTRLKKRIGKVNCEQEFGELEYVKYSTRLGGLCLYFVLQLFILENCFGNGVVERFFYSALGFFSSITQLVLLCGLFYVSYSIYMLYILLILVLFC